MTAARGRTRLLMAGLVATVCSGGLWAGAALVDPPAPSAQQAPTGDFELLGSDPLLNRGMNSSLALHGDFAYIGSRTDGTHPDSGILVVNISDPKKPRVVSQIGPPAAAIPGESQRELRVWPDQDLLLVMSFGCHEAGHLCAGSAGGSPEPTFRFFDIRGRHAAEPKLVATYEIGDYPHEFFLWDDPAHPGRALLYITVPFITGAEIDTEQPHLIVTDISGARERRVPRVASLVPRARLEVGRGGDPLDQRVRRRAPRIPGRPGERIRDGGHLRAGQRRREPRHPSAHPGREQRPPRGARRPQRAAPARAPVCPDHGRGLRPGARRRAGHRLQRAGRVPLGLGTRDRRRRPGTTARAERAQGLPLEPGRPLRRGVIPAADRRELLLPQPDPHPAPRADHLALGRAAGIRPGRPGKPPASRGLHAGAPARRGDRGPRAELLREGRHVELPDRQGRADLRGRHPQRPLRPALPRPVRDRAPLPLPPRGQLEHRPGGAPLRPAAADQESAAAGALAYGAPTGAACAAFASNASGGG